MTDMDQGTHSATGSFRKDGGPPYVEPTPVEPERPTIEGPTVAHPVVTPDLEREVHLRAQERRHERFGGGKIGAAFFGWLVAVGMTVLLTAVAAIVGAALFPGIALGPIAPEQMGGIGLVSAITVLVVLALAYLAGGYVAGRLARFDGTRNGVLAWVVGAVLTVVLSLIGAVAGTQLDLAGRLAVPAVEGDLGMLTIGGIIALVAALLVTLLAAATGGRLGERFHHRVDKGGIAR